MFANRSAAALLAVALLAVAAAAADRAPESPRLIVAWQGIIAPSVLVAQGLEVVAARVDLGLFLVMPPNGVSIDDVRAALSQVPGFRFVEPDQTVVADQISLAFIDQRVHDRHHQESYPGQGQSMPDPGAPRARVALLDTGADFHHSMLRDCLSTQGQDYVGDDVTPAEETSAVDLDHDGQWNESYGHGTHAAGLIAALSSWHVEIMPMRVLDADGNGTLFDVVQALHDARRSAANIYQLSLSAASDSLALHEAVQAIIDAGGLVIASAGNGGSETPRYPAAYPGVVAVAAAAGSGVLLETSSYGAHVSFSADGDEVLSTYPDERYAYWSGSSMATSVVSAIAASIWLDAEHTRAGLVAAAIPIDDLNPGKEGQVGLGLGGEVSVYE